MCVYCAHMCNLCKQLHSKRQVWERRMRVSESERARESETERQREIRAR